MASISHSLYDMKDLLLVWMFILRVTRLSNKLLEQGYVKEIL